MRKREIRHPDANDNGGAFSAAVLIDGWLHVSGHGPLNMKTGAVVKGTIEAQTRLTLSNIGQTLAAAGCGFADVVKCTCYLADIGHWEKFNRVYAEFFHGVRPARTTIQARLDGIGVEIDAIARVPRTARRRRGPQSAQRRPAPARK